MKTVYSEDMRGRFYKIRKELGLTQDEIAKLLGITSGYYSKLENADKPVKESTVIAICNTLNVRMEYILTGEEPMFREDRLRQRLLELYDELPEDSQRMLVNFLEYNAEMKLQK